MSRTKHRNKYEKTSNYDRNKSNTLKDEYSRIRNLYVTNDFQRALWECNDFMLKYPNMEKARALKAAILRKMGRYDEALIALEREFLYDDYVCVERIRNYMCLGRYEEAYELLLEINPIKVFEKDERMQKECMQMDMVLLLQLDPELFKKTYTKSNYRDYKMNQFVRYDETAAIRYVKNNTKNDEIRKFSNAFDIDYQMTKYREKILSEKAFPDVLYDIYYFPYENCGVENGIPCNYVVVSAIKGTNQIVNIEPIPEERIRKEEQKEDYSSISTYPKRDMIKRFNDRYSKKRV